MNPIIIFYNNRGYERERESRVSEMWRSIKKTTSIAMNKRKTIFNYKIKMGCGHVELVLCVYISLHVYPIGAFECKNEIHCYRTTTKKSNCSI